MRGAISPRHSAFPEAHMSDYVVAAPPCSGAYFLFPPEFSVRLFWCQWNEKYGEVRMMTVAVLLNKRIYLYIAIR